MKKDTILTCPKCNKELVRVNTDVTYGMRITEILFSPINMTIVNKMKIESNCCNEVFLKVAYGLFHTKDGWLK